jgi:DNA mismatch repair protein MutL
MSPGIKILAPELIDQIAAGEVVERPASVVKELVENSLDAGAARIVCTVKEGGRERIEVVDDGEGMSLGDVVLATTRHATSKIASSEDLQRIATLGFRGEALSSISAVSRMRIVTRRKADPAGTLLLIEGGKRTDPTDTGAPAGTSIRVDDLFFNTPARRKFLRTVPTEMSHIQAWLSRLALAREDVHMILGNDQRRLLDAPATSDLTQRAAAVLGREVFEHLHPVAHEEEGTTVTGLVSDPYYTRANPKGIYLFVNGRFVRDRLLQHALMAGYQTVVPQGRFPVVVLRLRMDADTVDVNVHPQKTEVRFSDTQRIHRTLSAAVAGVLARAPWLKNTRTYVLQSSAGSDSGRSRDHASQVREALSRYHHSVGMATPGPSPVPVDRAPTAPGVDPAEEAPLSDWKLVGTLWNTYIFLSCATGLVVVDQHAAAERITFERLKSHSAASPVPVQRMLVPMQVELDGASMACLESHLERITELGFEVDPFGPATVNVTAVPAQLAHAPVGQLLRDVLDELSDVGVDASWERARLDVIGRMACHASIRAGKALSETEIRSLLSQLEKVDFAGTCPHGRPVLVRLGKAEVEHWFLRT